MPPDPDAENVVLPSETELGQLVRAFYSDARADPLLGPIFAAKVSDWDVHIAKISDFWSSVMLGSGRYKGNPFGAHIPLRELIGPQHFRRWLSLWGDAARRTLKPSAAAQIEQKAHRIAESLMAGVLFRPVPSPTRTNPPPLMP
jgi:hemoglobin